jgi:succinate dehydrogenase / fumarate reductase, membrane anchor subunit
MSLRTPLGRVLGRGAAKEGVHHWWVQRVTSVALIPLAISFVVSLVSLPALDYATVHAWVHQSWTAVLLSLFIALACWHSKLGLQVIVEDYVHGGAKTIFLILSTFGHTLIAAASIFAVLKVAFGTAT